MSPTETPRRIARIWIALILSLALNVFLLGVASTLLLKPQPPRHPPRLLGAIDSQLSPWARQRFQQARKLDSEQMRQHMEAMSAARAEVNAAMTNEPFDAVALDAAFAGLRRVEEQTASEVQKRLTQAMQGLSLEDRKALATGMAPVGAGRRADALPMPYGPGPKARPDGPPPGEDWLPPEMKQAEQRPPD
jgi:uncharacterized membrane protein